MKHHVDKFRAAYDAAMQAAKKPHPEAERDKDGHCTHCGFNWDEDIETYGRHCCPPGFYWVNPK